MKAALVGLLLLAGASASAGCLEQGPDDAPSAPACDLLGGPSDVARNAPSKAGSGPRKVTIANVPPGDAIAVEVPAVRGTTPGTWDAPVSFGPAEASWRPTVLPWADAGTMTRLQSLRLELTWDNGPGGGADFGIAVGPTTSGGFHYTNSDYQATPGPQTEARDLGPSDFAELGWTDATRPQAGPSVSTGAFATTGVAYELTWEATFGPDPDLADVCTTLGDVDAVPAPSG